MAGSGSILNQLMRLKDGWVPVRPGASGGGAAATDLVPISREVPHRLVALQTDLLGGLASSASPDSAAPASRLIGLDFLRMVAVALVFLRHSEGFVATQTGWLAVVLQPLVRGGWVGVDLFFVLSGVLVSGLIFRGLHAGRPVDPTRFWIRRAFKILPPFWTYLAFLVFAEWKRSGGVPWVKWVHELIFVQNYLPGLAGQTWSLAVEEHFYLLLPIGLLALTYGERPRVDRLKWIPWVFAGLAMVALGLRGWSAKVMAYSHANHLYPTHLRLDALFCGVVLGYWRQFEPEVPQRILRRLGILAWPIALGLLLPPFLVELGETSWLTTMGLTSNFLGCALLILLVLDWRWAGIHPDPWWLRAGAAVGGWSYCIYLWHLEWIGRAAFYGGGRLPWWLLMAISGVGSMATGALLTWIIERPALRLRDRLFPSQAPTADRVPASSP